MYKAAHKIKIMHVIHSLPADGAEQLLYDIIQNSDRRRFQHSVCALVEGGPLADELERIYVPVYLLNKRSKFDLTVIPRLARLLCRERIDILHSHMFTGFFWGTLSFLLSSARANVTTNHNTAYSKTSIMILIEKLFLPFVHKVINVSEEAFNSLRIIEQLPGNKLELIINGIDLNRFKDVRNDRTHLKKSIGLDQAKKIVATVSRLAEQKGHRYFLEAASQLAKEKGDVQFLIVGDGELRTSLEQCVKKRAELNGRIVFAGLRRDIPQIMQIVDVFVLPSLWEGLPIVLLEAMATGRRILATRVGGIPEVVRHKQTGYLVDPGDARQIAEGILWILEHEEESKTMGVQASEEVRKNFDVRAVVSRYEDLYIGLMS